MTRTLTVTALIGIPQVREGDDLAAHLAAGLVSASLALADGDVLAVSSKVVSKALGLGASTHDKAEAVRAESVAVVAERAGTTAITQVVRARSGPVMAAAGVDASNTGEDDRLLVLPHDPDAVCRELHERLAAATGVRRFGLLLTDTAGRAWRLGQTDFALGSHRVRVLDDLRGHLDTDGRPLEVTTRALADELAAAADLVKGKLLGIPAVLIRGLAELVTDDEDAPGARQLARPVQDDWFAVGAQEAVRAALGVPPGSPAARRAGIRSVVADVPADRVRRAVAVALATGLEAAVDAGPDRLEVTGEDPIVVGMVAARLITALTGEGLSCQRVRHTATSVDIEWAPD